MKTLVLGVLKVAAGVAFAFATAGSALAQTPYSAIYEAYNETVANPDCVGNTSCTFTFRAVPTFTTNAGSLGNLIVSRVSCRIVATAGGTNIPGKLSYAALGKTANAAKLFFLSSSVDAYDSSNSSGFSTNLIDQTTEFFVQAGASPTITIAVNNLPPLVFGAPNASLDQPTCTVTGLIE